MKSPGLVVVLLASALVVVAVVAIGPAGRRADPEASTERQIGAGKSRPERTMDAPAEKAVRTTDATSEAVEPITATGQIQGAIAFRSSIGLPLPFIEWEASEENWSRVDLDHGRCERAALRLPCRIRAPGHSPATVPGDAEASVLEPDALLELHADGLKGCASRILPLDIYSDHHEDETALRDELRNVLAWGWIADDRWALAVSSDLELDAMSGRPVDVQIRWSDGRDGRISFHPTPAARAVWTVPCDQLVETAPLDIHLVRPTEEGTSESIFLRVMRVLDRSAALRQEEFPWGRVSICPRGEFDVRARVAAGSADHRLEAVPVRERLILSAHEDLTCACGRLVFAHDGTPRTLVLHPGLDVVGRIVSDDGSGPVACADISWEGQDAAGPVWSWNSSALSLALGADGSFSQRGPRGPPLREEVSLDPPERIRLTVNAPGFAPFEREFLTGGGPRVDCGEIRLVPVKPELVLAPGHGVAPKQIRWEGLMTSAAPGVQWNIRDAASTPDGGLAIFLARSDKDPNLIQPIGEAARAWPDEPAKHVVLHVLLDGGDEPWAFDLGSEGRYVAVPRSSREVTFECRSVPSEDKAWGIGWQWNGIWDGVAQVPPWKLGGRVRARISAPSAGATLFWSGTGRPPRLGIDRGGSVPMESMPEVIILQ